MKNTIFNHLLFKRRLLVLVFIVAVAVRLFHISQQSIWFDEYLTYIALQSGSPLTCMYNLFFYVAEMAITPIYFLVSYSIAFISNNNIAALRIFNIITGLLSLTLLYFLVVRLSGHRAGLAAALCLTLSPQHIWHNQEIRPYSLLFLFCLAATWSLLKWHDKDSRKWFFVNCLFNGLLIFTHLFGILFLLPQGLYLLVRKEFKTFFRWSAAHMIFVVLLLLAVAAQPHLSEGYHPKGELSLSFIFLYFLPSLYMRSFCADALCWHSGLWPWFESTLSTAAPPWLSAFLKVRPIFDRTLTFLILVSIFWFVLLGWRHRPQNTITSDTISKSKWDEWILIVSIIFIPSTTLIILTLITWTNFSDYGHDIYTMIGIYAVIGIFLARLPLRYFRVAIVTLTILYGYQSILFFSGSTRTDWRSAAIYVKEHAQTNDIILDLFWYGPVSRKTPYFLDSSLEMCRVNTLISASDKAASFFNRPETDPKGASAWLLMETYSWREWFPNLDLIPLLRKTLDSRGLTFDIQEFPGALNMAAIRISQSLSEEYTFDPEPYPQLWMTDYNQILKTLGLENETADRRREILRNLETSIGIWPGVSACGRVSFPLDLIQLGDFTLAKAVAQQHILDNPSFGLGYLALALGWVAEGEKQRGWAAYQSACSHHLGIHYFFDGYFDALCNGNNLCAARDGLTEIYRLNVPIFYETAAYVLETIEKRQSQHENYDASEPVQSDGHSATTKPLDATNQFESYHFVGESLPLPDLWCYEDPGEKTTPWIDRLFAEQESSSRFIQWFPLQKYIRIFGITYYIRESSNFEAALKQCRKLIAQLPFEKKLYGVLDELLVSTNNPELYVQEWQHCASFNPEIASYAASRIAEAGKDWFKADRAGAAIHAYLSACALDDQNNTYMLRLAQLYDLCNATDDAIHWYCRVLENRSDLSSVLDRVQLLMANGTPAKNVAVLKELYGAHPDTWLFGILYGQTLELIEAYQDAMDVYEEMGRFYPNQPHTLLAACRCLRLIKALDSALQELDEITKNFPESKALIAYEYINLGQAFEKEMDLASAHQCFNTAIELGEYKDLAFYSLGISLLINNNLTAAKDALTLAIAYNAENPGYQCALAETEIKMGNEEAAILLLQEALRLSPEDTAITARLDQVLSQRRDKKAQLLFWEDLFAEFPDSQIIKNLLEDVKSR
ncbi:MAG: DUF2723 domain-containing protein [Candidatus Hydrogenedentes bacterium]|nr:DUF2723 domain-containing protein [Candidatus Hydrogenedentota bacterium]